MSETNSGQTENSFIPDNTGDARLDSESVQKALVKNRLKQMSGLQKAVCALGLVLILVLGACGIYKWMGSGSAIQYLTMQVSRGSIIDAIETTGTLEPVKKSEMGFKSDGAITAINVQPGDRVSAGQVLAEQDSTNLRYALQQAESSLAQDEINLKSCTLAYESSLKTFNRQQALFEAGAISQNDMDTARDNLTKSEWDIATAKAKLLNDQAKVAQAQSDLDEATLTAPFDGIIGAVNGQVGQINGINSSTSTLLTVMSEDLQLSALVNEADIGRIKVNQDVKFTSSAYADKTFNGKVLRITPEAKTVSNVQYYPVLISCIDPDHQLRSGMSVTAKIVADHRDNVLRVPMMAVSYGQSFSRNGNNSGANKASKTIIPGSEANGKTASVVVLENNQPVARQVVLGLSDGTNYEVIDGLNEGDNVIVGTNQTGSSTGTSSTNRTTTTNSSRQNQGGGPPGGGMMVRF